jgi:Ethylbenzene dehydrogenase
MKILKIVSLFSFVVLFFMYCTKTDQVVVSTASKNTTDLLSLKTTAGPTIDGVIDDSWAKATKLEITPTVPDPGNGLFAGYIGDKYLATLRSMYDDQYIYFLAEYADKDQNQKVAPWYFNPTTKLWAKEGSGNVYDANGVLTRQGFGEDKMAMLWNIDNSTPKFITQTCYASCHVFTPYYDYTTVGTMVAKVGKTALDSLVTMPTFKSNSGSGNHYTNGPNEKIDMWWMQPSKGLSYGKMDDNYQDYAGGQAITNLTGGNANGRHVDDLVVGSTATVWPFRPVYTTDASQGSFANTQNLKIGGTGATVAVPLYVIPGSTSNYINVADTSASGAAKKVTAVSATGVLTYSGGTLDPNTGTDYQRLGSDAYSGIGTKCIPSVIVSPLKNGRADIDCIAIYTGTGYIVEYRRKLKTGDVLKQDIDFTGLQDQSFGFAIWNRNNNQHAIQPNLMLKFQK